MNETCKAIDKLKELVKMFLGAQIELNDLNNEHIEKLEEKLIELDRDTTIVLKDLVKRVIVLEEKVKNYESQNSRIKDKMVRLNKEHTTDINDVQHRLNIIERERRRNNASNK